MRALKELYVSKTDYITPNRKEVNLLKPDVRVDDDGCAEDGIYNRAQGACGEGSNCKRNESGGNKPKSPILSALRQLVFHSKPRFKYLSKVQ